MEVSPDSKDYYRGIVTIAFRFIYIYTENKYKILQGLL